MYKNVPTGANDEFDARTKDEFSNSRAGHTLTNPTT